MGPIAAPAAQAGQGQDKGMPRLVEKRGFATFFEDFAKMARPFPRGFAWPPPGSAHRRERRPCRATFPAYMPPETNKADWSGVQAVNCPCPRAAAVPRCKVFKQPPGQRRSLRMDGLPIAWAVRRTPVGAVVSFGHVNSFIRKIHETYVYSYLFMFNHKFHLPMKTKPPANLRKLALVFKNALHLFTCCDSMN